MWSRKSNLVRKSPHCPDFMSRNPLASLRDRGEQPQFGQELDLSFRASLILVGGEIGDLFDTGWLLCCLFLGVGIKTEWHKESVEDKLEQREGTFVLEQGVSITTKETVRVGNHSCVKVDAKTAVLDNFPLPVVVTVEFKIDGSSTKERIEDAGNFMRLLKFSGKRLSYDEGAGVVTLRKNGVVELTSFVSMETNIQQVKCNCRKSM